MPTPMRIIKNLLWIDCTAAALAGVMVLLFSAWLSHLYSMPQVLLHFIGVVNLLAAGYSFSLAIRPTRQRPLVILLVIANGIWAVVCLGIAVNLAGTATFLGIGLLVGEAIFVGGLAGLEWKWREQLLSAA